MTERKIWLFAVLLLALSCQTGDERDNTHAVNSKREEAPSLILSQDGKKLGGTQFEKIYQASDFSDLSFPIITTQTLKILDSQLKLLENPRIKRNQRIGNLGIHVSDLKETVDILKSRQQTLPIDLSDHLDAYQIWGKDRRGNVKLTGYFTPLIKVSKTKNAQFKYPIYSRPKNWEGRLPSRKEIEADGVLDTLGLELAYAEDKVDIYYMQVQGSGFVEYPDGSRELMSYNGTNRHPYRSIERFIKNTAEIELTNLSIDGIKNYLKDHPQFVDTVLFYNPSYTFFMSRKNAEPIGAGMVPLTAEYSIAVDKKYIPLGSCLLASFPIYDMKERKVVGHDYKLVFAQDVGGAIRGPGHIDYYFGIGDTAKRKAGNLNHYGQLWLLLPKRQIGPIFTSY